MDDSMEEQNQGQDVEEAPQADMGNEESEAQPQPSPETLSVQKRLKAQKRAHERELRDLHSRIGELESRTQSQQAPAYSPQDMGVDEQIHKAVSYALQHKEMQERQAQEAQSQAHVNRQHQELQRHLTNMGDKYDDFDEVVLGNHAPFTPAMAQYALTLPRNGSGSAGEVLYKLGKNPDELARIAKLHPIDQASEMARLSHALISGSQGESKSSAQRAPLGSIKSNPVTNSSSVNEKTSIGELRARMKAGWK